jgi:S-adenosylmethionine hydrolase
VDTSGAWSIVTLTTDFGIKDYFVSATKAALFSEISNVNIVDISHQISPYNVTEAAYIIKNAYKSFPKGSIHLIGVDSELTPENKHLVMFFDDHYFIGADNGIFSLVINGKIPDKIVSINIHENIITSFPILDIFVKIAAHISREGKLEVIGKKINSILELTNVNPVINTTKNKILGSVIYIDNYGNVITNITEKVFNEVGKSRQFIINARTIEFDKVYKNYSEAIDFNIAKDKREEDGKKIALFNTAGHLELAIYKSNPSTVGSASSLFGLNYRDSVTILFN